MTSLPDSSAMDILANLVESGGSLGEMCMLASMYLELGEHEKALRYASAAVDREPTFIPARDVLAKVNVALRDYDSALSHFEALGILGRDQHPMPPDEYSIPAHFALHNAEQLDHILAGKGDEEVPAASPLRNCSACGATSRTSSRVQKARPLGRPSTRETVRLWRTCLT